MWVGAAPPARVVREGLFAKGTCKGIREGAGRKPGGCVRKDTPGRGDCMSWEVSSQMTLVLPEGRVVAKLRHFTQIFLHPKALTRKCPQLKLTTSLTITRG